MTNLNGESGTTIDGNITRVELRGETPAGVPVTFEAISETGNTTILRILSTGQTPADVPKITSDLATKFNLKLLHGGA